MQAPTGIVDALSILPNDPDHGRLGLGLIQGFQVLAQGADDALVAVGVAPATGNTPHRSSQVRTA